MGRGSWTPPAAYEHMAAEDLDLVVHLGDYIYECGVGTNKRGVTVSQQFTTEAFDRTSASTARRSRASTA